MIIYNHKAVFIKEMFAFDMRLVFYNQWMNNKQICALDIYLDRKVLGHLENNCVVAKKSNKNRSYIILR